MSDHGTSRMRGRLTVVLFVCRWRALGCVAMCWAVVMGVPGCSNGAGPAVSRSGGSDFQPVVPLPRGFDGVEVVWRDGRRVDAGGFASVGRTPSVSRTVFDIGSVAKSFTAAAVLRLQAAGRLKIDDPISRVLPAVPPMDRSITISSLLTHTSGLPTYFSSDRADISSSAAVKEILALPRNRAGTFHYSDAGYTLLAAIVQHVSGEPFRTYIATKLLLPAGMTHTGWYGEPPPPGTAAAHGYVKGADRGLAGEQVSPTWSTLGAGGMISTADDIARWASALLNNEVLPASAVRRLFTPRIPLPGAPGRASVAYGWITGHAPHGARLLLVGGGTDYGFTSDVRIYPASDVVTVALSNNNRTPALLGGTELQRLATG
jgi:CubicO group peptidase (beta-lactamase class C family)